MSNDNVFLVLCKDDIILEEFESFKQEHKHEDVYFGAIGGNLQYIITPTSLGLICSVKCSHCNVEKDITNFVNF